MPGADASAWVAAAHADVTRAALARYNLGDAEVGGHGNGPLMPGS